MPEPPNPTLLRHLWRPDVPYAEVACEGPFRELSVDGRTGINAVSLHSRMALRLPELNGPRGTLSLWLLALEELSAESPTAHIARFQPDYRSVPVLCDSPDLREPNGASFAMTFVLNWYPHFFVKRTKGGIYTGPVHTGENSAYRPTPSAIIGLGHWPVRRERWYHVAYTWDHGASDYRLYLNGVLAGTSIQEEEAKPLRCEPAGETLYAGHPKLVLSDLRVEDAPLDGEALRERMEADRTPIGREVQSELERTYAGVGVPKLDWRIPEDWQTALELPLTGKDALEDFYVQSHNPAMARATDEGIRVRTPFERTSKPGGWDEEDDEPFDADQLYLWLERFFEGDICLSFEFKSRSDRGLALLAAQASGMHREDFMADHPRRKTGSMRMVHSENVRNYHWEYYRHMNDTRHDVASSGLIKQPWHWPLAYQCLDRTLELDVWHTLTFIHHGDRLIGAINEHVMFDLHDNPHANNGPVYRCGRFGLRCMWRSDITYRNLRVSMPPEGVVRPG